MLLSNRFLIWYDRISNRIKIPKQNKLFRCVENVFIHCDKRDKNVFFFTLYFSQRAFYRWRLRFLHTIYYFLLSLPVTQFPEYCQITANIYTLFCYFVCVSLRNWKTTKSKLVSQFVTAVFLPDLVSAALNGPCIPIVSCTSFYKRRNNNKNQ